MISFLPPAPVSGRVHLLLRPPAGTGAAAVDGPADRLGEEEADHLLPYSPNLPDLVRLPPFVGPTSRTPPRPNNVHYRP